MPKRKPLTPEQEILEAGQELREARQQAELTQAEVAEEVGLPRGQTHVSEIERMGKHVKSWRIIETIRDVLGMK